MMGVAAPKESFESVKTQANELLDVLKSSNQKDGLVNCTTFLKAARALVDEGQGVFTGQPMLAGFIVACVKIADQVKFLNSDPVWQVDSSKHEILKKALEATVKAVKHVAEGVELGKVLLELQPPSSNRSNSSTPPPKKDLSNSSGTSSDSEIESEVKVNPPQPPEPKPEPKATPKEDYTFSPFLVFAPNTSVVASMNQVAQVLEQKVSGDAHAKSPEEAVSTLSKLFKNIALGESKDDPNTVSDDMHSRRRFFLQQEVERRKTEIEKAQKTWKAFVNPDQSDQGRVMTTLLDDDKVLSNMVYTRARLGLGVPGRDGERVSLGSLAKYQRESQKYVKQFSYGKTPEKPKEDKIIRVSQYERSKKAWFVNTFRGKDEVRRQNHTPIFDQLQKQLKKELVGEGDSALASLDNPIFSNELALCLGINKHQESGSAGPVVVQQSDIKTFLNDSEKLTPEVAQKLLKFVAKCYVAGLEVGGPLEGSGSNIESGMLLASIIQAQADLKPLEWVDDEKKRHSEAPDSTACKEIITDLLNQGLGLNLDQEVSSKTKDDNSPVRDNKASGSNTLTITEVPDWKTKLDEWAKSPNPSAQKDRTAIAGCLKKLLQPFSAQIHHHNAVLMAEFLLEEYSPERGKHKITDNDGYNKQIEKFVHKWTCEVKDDIATLKLKSLEHSNIKHNKNVNIGSFSSSLENEDDDGVVGKQNKNSQNSSSDDGVKYDTKAEIGSTHKVGGISQGDTVIGNRNGAVPFVSDPDPDSDSDSDAERIKG